MKILPCSAGMRNAAESLMKSCPFSGLILGRIYQASSRSDAANELTPHVVPLYLSVLRNKL